MEGINMFELGNFLCNVIVAACSIIGVVAVIVACISYKYNKSKERAEKAIDMAKYFMEEILTGLAIIEFHYKEMKIDKIIKKYKFLSFEDFDEEELKELFTEEEISEINKKIYEKKIVIEESDDVKKEIAIPTFTSELLNRLEYMCMNISSGVADDRYIYDSLHQSFLNSVHLLYIHIAQRNKNEKDKLYRSVIKVYNKWKDKYFKEQKREEKINTSINKKIKKIKKKMGNHKKIN